MIDLAPEGEAQVLKKNEDLTGSLGIVFLGKSERSCLGTTNSPL